MRCNGFDGSNGDTVEEGGGGGDDDGDDDNSDDEGHDGEDDLSSLTDAYDGVTVLERENGFW